MADERRPLLLRGVYGRTNVTPTYPTGLSKFGYRVIMGGHLGP